VCRGIIDYHALDRSNDIVFCTAISTDVLWITAVVLSTVNKVFAMIPGRWLLEAAFSEIIFVEKWSVHLQRKPSTEYGNTLANYTQT